MPRRSKVVFHSSIRFAVMALMIFAMISQVYGADLQEIKQRGTLRHLGVPYANFVTGSGDGMEVELVKLFARHIGVKYQYIRASWDNVIGDLTGKQVKPKGDEVEVLGEVPIRGDVVANGLTILTWRKKMVDFSTPVFPTQVWLVARADSPLAPITPNHAVAKDIQAVKMVLKGHSLLGKANTCLDPSLYGLKETGAQIKLFHRDLNEMAPAIINGEAEFTLLDVPDALVALKKFPGKIKVIGPLSPVQEMACAFNKNSPSLRDAFNQFLAKCKSDGTFVRLTKKYYPGIFAYFPKFFSPTSSMVSGG